MKPLKQWEVIRSHWVNGEKEEALELFKQNWATFCLAGIRAYQKSFTPTAHSGDLIDLQEILQAIIFE